MSRVTEILAKIAIGVIIFFVSFAMIIVKAVVLDGELTLTDLYTFICIDIMIFSSYFIVIYISKSSILLQALHLIPYLFLLRLNFAPVQSILKWLALKNYSLNFTDKIIIYDSTIFIILFIVNIIFIISEKTKTEIFKKLEKKLNL